MPKAAHITKTLDEKQVWTLRQALETAGEVYNDRRLAPRIRAKVRKDLENEEAAILEVAMILEASVLVTCVVKEDRANG